ncbi:MAG TPA: hypothetical protein VL240_07140 [Candidatus Binatia bacterium]|nr:hypothetical protein [Candidatus Binatia bacterium]
MERFHNPKRPSGHPLRPVRGWREAGYVLLAVMLMMAFLVITATYVVAPYVVQQIKRDREEELIHRGTEYARAIKKFYKKNGRYPASLDDLDKGQIRFLRKRYKDPLTKDGKWKLLNYADIATMLNTAAPGTPAALMGTQGGTLTPGGAVVPGGASSSPFGIQQQQRPGPTTGFPVNSDQGSNPEGVPSGNFTGFPANSDQGSNPEATAGTNQPFSLGNSPQSGSASQPGGTGSIFGQNPGGDQTFGGGAIVGVASMSKDPTIRLYNKKKKYNEWVFIYNPMMDQQNVLLRGPYQPTTIGGAQIGTPAGQLNQQPGAQQQSPFGQQNTPQPNQPQQPMQPGNRYPPDQNQLQ